MNRILLYVHFNKNNELSEHIVYQLKKLNPLFSRVVFITNSKMSAENKMRLTGLYDDFIERENKGFDFAAWRDGIKDVGWKNLERYDSLTLMNDTCFGPIYPMDRVYESMESKEVDFWGLTEYEGAKDSAWSTGDLMQSHIQSYFQVFNRKVVKSNQFKKFWAEVMNETSVFDVIEKYETRLTHILEQRGFLWQVFLNTTEYSKGHHIDNIRNYSELMPNVILREHVPLLKVKSFLHALPGTLERKINKTSYPKSLIKDHLRSMGITNPLIVKLIARREIINILGINTVRKLKGFFGISRKNEL